MSHRIFSAILLAVVFSAAASSIQADVPRLISYQGKVTDNAGVPIAGPVNLTVRLSTAPVLGILLFTESHDSVPLSGGVFSISIGANTAGGVPDAALDSAEIWLSVSVNGAPELTPRVRLVSVPYAVKSKVAQSLVQPGSFTAVATTNASGHLQIPTGRIVFGSGNTPLIQRELLPQELGEAVIADRARLSTLPVQPPPAIEDIISGYVDQEGARSPRPLCYRPRSFHINLEG